MAGASIASLLNNIWAAFRSVGITDDLRIIEQLAALLLEQKGVQPGSDRSLPALSVPEEFNLDDVRQQLKDASAQAGGAGVLFDRSILFRLDTMRAGGQYPTPRHIVRLMTALAETTKKVVADFACGSGGLLIHSQGSSLVGVDISPEWARIARANLQLHEKQGDIREGNALRVIKSDERFERIVMNPPFGEKIKSDFGVRSETARSETARSETARSETARSETALINLALNRLESGGRAALLAPSGVLFSSSSAEEKLRRRLVEEVTLEAIITLPDDAFQPYSALTTHLLLIENKQPVEKGCTWFLRPVYDGYVSGRGRDLTTDPKMPNDLTLVERTVAAFRQPPAFQSETPLAVQPLSENGALLGYVIRPAVGASLLSVRHLPAQGKEPSMLLLEVEAQEKPTAQSQEKPTAQSQKKPTVWKFALPVSQAPEEKALEEVTDAETFIRKRLGLKKSDPLPPPDVFQVQTIRWGSTTRQAIGGLLVKTFDAERPQLMGVAIPQAVLKSRGYTLQPDDYLRPPEIRAELRRPHDTLLDIYRRQQALAQRMNRLAGLLVPQRSPEYSIPGKVDVQAPFGALSAVQRNIWQAIEGFKDGESARPFTAADIAVDGCTESEKRLTLEMFEAMGLIVPITLKHPESGQLLNFYRLAESNDRWTAEESEA